MEKYLKTFLIVFSISILAQTGSNQKKLDEMINYFFVGLNEKALELGAQLMTLEEDPDIQEKAMFFVADYFFREGEGNEKYSDYLSRAAILFNRILKKYPNSRFKPILTLRLGNISERNFLSLEKERFSSFYEQEFNEYHAKTQLLNRLFKFKNISPYEVFNEKDIINSSIETADKYLSDIIVNNPSFDLEVYSYRIFILLDKILPKGTLEEVYRTSGYKRHNVLESFLKGDYTGVYKTEYESWKRDKDSLDMMLDYISKKYPSDYRTLTYHFIFAKLFFYEEDDLICHETYRHLKFILENDPNKLSYLYLLTKEFVLNNKFMTK